MFVKGFEMRNIMLVSLDLGSEEKDRKKMEIKKKIFPQQLNIDNT